MGERHMERGGSTTAKDRLLDAAVRLFEAEGIRACGIDRLLAQAGVAKMSLYKHFASKDDLVVVALRRKDDRFRDLFRATVEARRTPRTRLLAAFDALERWFARPDFRGCLFLNTAAEMPERDCPARRVVAEHKAWVHAQFATLALEADVPDPGALARQLVLVFDGAIARAYATQDPGVARDARSAAAALLDRAVGAG